MMDSVPVSKPPAPPPPPPPLFESPPDPPPPPPATTRYSTLGGGCDDAPNLTAPAITTGELMIVPMFQPTPWNPFDPVMGVSIFEGMNVRPATTVKAFVAPVEPEMNILSVLSSPENDSEPLSVK